MPILVVIYYYNFGCKYMYLLIGGISPYSKVVTLELQIPSKIHDVLSWNFFVT